MIKWLLLLGVALAAIAMITLARGSGLFRRAQVERRRRARKGLIR